jgi:hypothetical protein
MEPDTGDPWGNLNPTAQEELLGWHLERCDYADTTNHSLSAVSLKSMVILIFLFFIAILRKLTP